jgi:plasmid stabilization system protein ParE
MRKYRVSFIPAADRQIMEAFNWGVEFWGREQAEVWLRELYRATFDRLAVFPKSCVVAPESDRLCREVRQYVFGRYRILFEIRGHDVIVLRLSGPFNTRGGK